MFQIWVLGTGERLWATNGKQYDTQEAAQEAANDLWGRWFGAENIAVVPTTNWTNGLITTQVVRDEAVFTTTEVK